MVDIYIKDLNRLKESINHVQWGGGSEESGDASST